MINNDKLFLRVCAGWGEGLLHIFNGAEIIHRALHRGLQSFHSLAATKLKFCKVTPDDAFFKNNHLPSINVKALTVYVNHTG